LLLRRRWRRCLWRLIALPQVLAQVLAHESRHLFPGKKGGQRQDLLWINRLPRLFVRPQQLEQLALVHERRQTGHQRQARLLAAPTPSQGAARPAPVAAQADARQCAAVIDFLGALDFPTFQRLISTSPCLA
jgi:hypothetical protein